MEQANDGDRTRDTNLEGWDVTATPHSQCGGIIPQHFTSHGLEKYKTNYINLSSPRSESNRESSAYKADAVTVMLQGLVYDSPVVLSHAF